MFDGQAFGEEIVGIVRDYVDKAVAPLKAENAELKARLKAVEDRPAPEKGEPGDSIPVADVEAMVAKAVTAAVAAIDLPEVKDGVGVAGALIDREGHLVLTLSDGTTRDLGKVVGKDGEPGNDGLGFEDLDACVLDDDRTIEFSFRRGDDEKAFTFKWPTVIDRGVYKAGEDYAAGDGVSWGGSFWIAQRDTNAKPDTADSGWRLAVKKGRDGKDVR